MKYNYGNEISYKYDLVKPEDYDKLQAFSCGNKLENYVRNEVITNGCVNNDDGLIYKVYDSNTLDVIGIVSLAASGIIHQSGAYTHLLPAVKIDVFAIEIQYQKLHYDTDSEKSDSPDDHYYFSDDIMGHFISMIRNISEQLILANYILLYADRNAYRFYQRNGFSDFEEFMQKEENMEINENIPMYMQI